MRLIDIIQIYSGGVGSGCNPSVGKCGRPATGRTLSQRAHAAKASYIPVTSAKYQLAKRNERSVAKILNGVPTANNSPFDVIVNGKIGVEVKTIIEGRHDKITMHPSSLKEKNDEMRRMKLMSVFTVVADHRGASQKWFVREGLGSFRLGTLTPVAKISGLKGVIF